MFTLVRDCWTCFYGNGTGHPNGHDNINRSLGERRAMMDRRIGVAACSVSEGECSARRCTAIQTIVEESGE